MSRADNLKQAMDRGFNLVGLSNNHSRDCTSPDGEAMTAQATAALADAKHAFHGVGDAGRKNDVKVTTFVAQGKSIRVAFGSLYLGSRRACTGSVCANDKRALFENLRGAAADLRVVAIHSMNGTTQDELVHAGIEFVKSYDGDVVFGSGPHVWKPVRVVRKQSGKTGVIFESLGNFLHPNLAAQQKNYIGRALFDPNALVLRQVQVIPVYNTGSDVKFSTADLRTLPSNLKLKTSERGGFANVKP
ncbi:MAG: CapA family protein [Myxococcales bacterium]|nr:CapA family protein [Myxococcales bacterium]